MKPDNQEVVKKEKKREDIIWEVKGLLFRNQSPNAKKAFLIVLFTSLIPAMMLMGFMGKSTYELIRELHLSTIFLMAGLGGAIGLSILHPDPKYRFVGIIPGFILGDGVLIFSIVYLSFREAIIQIEVIIPLTIGIIPGYTLYYFLLKRKVLKDAGF